jgi:hypothetical protein
MNGDKQGYELQIFEQFLAISKLRLVPGAPWRSEPE